MQVQKFTCEVCGLTAELDAEDWFAPKRPQGWLAVRVARAPGWHSQKNVEFVGGNMMRHVDAWPAASRWREAVTPPQPVDLDFCSEHCAFEGMRKLHDGATVVWFEGPSPLTARELSFVLNYRREESVETA